MSSALTLYTVKGFLGVNMISLSRGSVLDVVHSHVPVSKVSRSGVEPNVPIMSLHTQLCIIEQATGLTESLQFQQVKIQISAAQIQCQSLNCISLLWLTI